MKKLVVPFLSLVALLSLAGCSQTGGNNGTDDDNQNANQDDNQDKGDDNQGNNDDVDDGSSNDGLNSNVIVVYYSATNHTEAVAQTIAKHINSAIYELEPVNPYTSDDLNYGNSSSRVVQEHNQIVNGEDVQVDLVTTDFDGFDEADYIFLGAPVWWQELSWVIEDFVSENDFTGKTIIPFGTSSASQFTLGNIEPLAEEATWMEPQRFRSSVSSSDVTAWVDSLNLSFN